jgi:hypothetical protein
MPAWFDLMSLDPNGAEDDKGIQKSTAVIVKLIEEEISNGIDPSRYQRGFYIKEEKKEDFKRLVMLFVFYIKEEKTRILRDL